MKKTLSVLLSLIMLIASVPMLVLADETDDGICYVDYNDGVRIYSYKGTSPVVNIPGWINGKKVLKLNTSAFSYVESNNTPYLTSVTIPDTITEIEGVTFRFQEYLTEISFPDSVTSIGSQTASFCTRLKSVKLPCNLKEIMYEFFYECNSLSDVNIPDGVTKIGKWAFYNCSSLKEIDLPDCVTLLDNYCFQGCTSLEKFVMPASVKYIYPSIFEGCTNLKCVYLNNNLKSMYRSAFKDCPSLTDIYYAGSEEEWNALTFYDDDYLKDVTIHFNSKMPCKTHAMKEIPAKKATTSSTGNNKYYQCTVCGKYFKDKDGKTETTVEAETLPKLAKKANPLTAKGKTVKIKYSVVKKKNVTIKRADAITVKKAKGTVTYSKISGPKKVSVSKKSGNIKIMKGLAKGTYKVKIKVKAAGTSTYKPGSKTVTVTIKVK